MKKLNIGEVEFDTEDVARKVESDIAFLVKQLHLLEQQKLPNAAVLQTYREMLDTRYAVLGWLRLGTEGIDDQKAANY